MTTAAKAAALERAQDFLCPTQHRGLNIVHIIDMKSGQFVFECAACGKQGTTLKESYWNPVDTPSVSRAGDRECKHPDGFTKFGPEWVALERCPRCGTTRDVSR